MSIGVADVVWSWTSKDVKSRQAKEEDVVKGWDATEQDEACDPIFILGSFGGVQGISGTKGKAQTIGRETALILGGFAKSRMMEGRVCPCRL